MLLDGKNAIDISLTRERIAEVSGADVDPSVVLQSIALMTTLRRAPALAQVAATAAFLASDRAGDITATTVNVSCGLIPG